MDDILKEFSRLNSFQKMAANSEEKYVALKAAVGSGKTTVIINRVLYLHYIKKVPLDEMMIVTFTNKAADEIKERIKKYISEDINYIGTFHSIAAKILREKIRIEDFGYTKDFKIISYQEAGDILNRIIEEGKLKVKYKSKLQKRIEEFKNGNILYGNMKNEDDIKKLYEMYSEVKKKENLMDYDDLIINCIEFLKECLNIKYIIIDEFQDTDFMQYELIKKIASNTSSIFVVGDPNQTIYSFRTGSSDIFDRFIREFDACIYDLPINYRSTKIITEAATALIGDKILSSGDEGEKIKISCHYDAFNEANYILRRIKELKEKGVKLGDIAILYRRQMQGDVLYDVLSREFECEFLKGLEVEKEKIDNDRLKLLTLHSSKGLEFDHIFIVGVNEGNIPIANKRDVEEEELRLFFVGITRARKTIELTYLKNPSYFGFKPYKSRYISLIPKSLVIEEDYNSKYTLNEIYDMLRLEKVKKQEIKKVVHKKYGEGIVLFEDDNTIKVQFEGYGEKEFLKAFSLSEFI